MARQALGYGDVLLKLVRVFLDGLLARLKLDYYARKSLGERVVYLPRHPVTLFQHGEVARLVEYAGVLDRHR